MKKPKKPFTAWMAVSAQGYVAWFIGFHPTRTVLRESYSSTFDHTLEAGGYRAQRVRVTVETGGPA